MRVLVAGDVGYIGAVLVPFLSAVGYEVQGLDLGLYAGDAVAAPVRPSAIDAHGRAAGDRKLFSADRDRDCDWERTQRISPRIACAELERGPK